MKRSIYMLIITLILVFPLEIKALTGEVIVQCDKNDLSLNATTNCKITCSNFSEEISSYHSVINIGKGLEIVSITKDSIWNGEAGKDGSGVYSIDLYTDTNKSGNFEIASFTIKLIESGTYDIVNSDIVVSDAAFNEHTINSVNYSITTASTSDDSNKDSNKDSNNEDSNKDNNLIDNPKTGIPFIPILSIMLISGVAIYITYKKINKLNERKDYLNK